MPKNAFLTPDSLQGQQICFEFGVSAGLFRFIAGALAELTSPANWEMHGAVTPDEAAEFFANLLYGLESKDCTPVPPSTAVLKRTSGVFIQNNSLTTMIFHTWTTNDPETFDVGNAQIECLKAGWYTATFDCYFSNAVAGSRVAGIWNVQENVWSALSQYHTGGTAAASMPVTALLHLDAGDTLQAKLLQITGGDLFIGVGTFLPRLEVIYHGG